MREETTYRREFDEKNAMKRQQIYDRESKKGALIQQVETVAIHLKTQAKVIVRRFEQRKKRRRKMGGKKGEKGEISEFIPPDINRLCAICSCQAVFRDKKKSKKTKKEREISKSVN